MDREDVAGLIAAAGGGSRLGRGPKAFVTLDGRALLSWAVDALRPFVGEVVVAVPEAEVETAQRMTPDARVIAGADARQRTVALLAEATSLPWVVIHDAARPFLDADTVRSVLEALPRARALTVATPVADSLVDGRDGTTVDRSRLWAVQTPQAFERRLLLEAHAAARAAGVDATDDAALVRRLGVPVELVPGGAHLMKITTAADLRLAEAYARGLRQLTGVGA